MMPCYCIRKPQIEFQHIRRVSQDVRKYTLPDALLCQMPATGSVMWKYLYSDGCIHLDKQRSTVNKSFHPKAQTQVNNVCSGKVKRMDKQIRKNHTELGRVSKVLKHVGLLPCTAVFLFFQHMFSPLGNKIVKGVESFQCLYKCCLQGFFTESSGHLLLILTSEGLSQTDRKKSQMRKSKQV